MSDTGIRDAPTILLAFLFSLSVPAIGYFYLGPLVAVLFLIGYLGGFILWLIVPRNPAWASIKIPFWSTFLVFIFLHKVEENVLNFFPVLSARVTGVPVPEVTPALVIGLLILPIGAWILTPFLVQRGRAVGYFLAWSFFASMGITELAHFVFPLLIKGPYDYFPGMASVVVLAPLAWWGMWRLLRKLG